MEMSPRRKAGPVQGLTLLSCVTLSVMGALLIAPVMPQMLAHFKDTPNVEYWVPTLVTIPALCVALFSPLAGWLGDRFGRRRLLIPAMAIYALCGIAPLFLDDLNAILASRVGVGITEAVVVTLSTTMIGDLFSGQARDKWLAGQTATASTSAILFLVIGGFAGRFGWKGPFIVYLFPLLLMALLVVCTWESRTTEQRDHASGKSSAVRFPYSFMAGVCAVSLFGALMFFAVQINLSQALDVLGVKDPGLIGMLTAVASLAVPVGTFVFWRLARWLSVRQLLMVEFALMGTAYLLMTQAADYRLFVLLAGVSQIGAGMVLPTVLTWAMSGLEAEVRGAGTGLWQSIFAFGQFACGLFFPFVNNMLGLGTIATFALLGAGCVAAAVVCLVAGLTHRRHKLA